MKTQSSRTVVNKWIKPYVIGRPIKRLVVGDDHVTLTFASGDKLRILGDGLGVSFESFAPKQPARAKAKRRDGR